ncbi:nucleotidyltransferase-like protein [Roseiarcus fermentans]|uniref:Nucleotidyltransferase-like protein n=1 Tax=Roseiarcus fermentans TaxID=1473586 RepID=A0A366EX70_9HYPH|nr:nucleotidyltransferase domain-containing protein [Roseiarcus fermentans]RBP06516.1 nucleotidyltransferase-like protein [Roseiarcus fermentans]
MAVSVPVDLDARIDENPRAVASVERRLAESLGTLRRRKDDLRARHIDHMWIFGSVARGEEHADSDVDIVVEIDPEARVSLTSFAAFNST